MKTENTSLRIIVLMAFLAAVGLAFFSGIIQPTGTTRVGKVRIGVLTPLAGEEAYFMEGRKAMAELMPRKAVYETAAETRLSSLNSRR